MAGESVGMWIEINRMPHLQHVGCQAKTGVSQGVRGFASYDLLGAKRQDEGG